MRSARGAVAIGAGWLAGAGCSSSSAAPPQVEAGVTSDPTDAVATAIGDVPDAGSTTPDAFVSNDGRIPTFSRCDSTDAEGACTTGPMGFDGGADASYPAGCVAYFGGHDGCTCEHDPTAGYVWSCTLK